MCYLIFSPLQRFIFYHCTGFNIEDNFIWTKHSQCSWSFHCREIEERSCSLKLSILWDRHPHHPPGMVVIYQMWPIDVRQNGEQTYRDRKPEWARKFAKKKKTGKSKQKVLTGSCGWGCMPGRDGLALKRWGNILLFDARIWNMEKMRLNFNFRQQELVVFLQNITMFTFSLQSFRSTQI